jgi:MFS family permease
MNFKPSRFLSGTGGSAPALGGGLLADCWRAEEQGRSLSLYYTVPLVGPAIGPIAGAYITQHLGWRWMFYVMSLLNASIQIAGLMWLDETFAPTLLARKVKRLKLQTSNHDLYTEYEQRDQRLHRVLVAALIRPCKLLGRQIIIQILAIYTAYIYGLLYLLLSTFSAVWIDKYKESIDKAGLNYISTGIEFFLGTQICAPINDHVRKASPSTDHPLTPVDLQKTQVTKR